MLNTCVTFSHLRYGHLFVSITSNVMLIDIPLEVDTLVNRRNGVVHFVRIGYATNTARIYILYSVINRFCIYFHLLFEKLLSNMESNEFNYEW